MRFETFEELREEFENLKRNRRLHPVTEERLGDLLNEIYPGGYAKTEPGEVPGARADLGFYFGDGKYVIFEIFATVSQVPQDLRHLELSDAQVRIAILTDPQLDGGKIFEEYHRKRPRNPFPWMMLSDILVLDREENAKSQLKHLIEEGFRQSGEFIEEIVDLDSRLEYYSLRNPRNLNFGRNEVTESLVRLAPDSIPMKPRTEPAPHFITFLAIPMTRVPIENEEILNAAYDVFEQWHDPQSDTAKYLGSRIFPLGSIDPRIDQTSVNVTQTVPGTNDSLVTVRVNQSGEVLAAESHYAFVTRGETVYLQLGSIIHLLWSFLGLVRAVQERIEYVGNYYICVALANTEGAYLGHFASEFRRQDPLDTRYFWSPGGTDPISQQENIIVCRDNVDLLTMEVKEQPELLHLIARDIARAFNQREALCFSEETGDLPDELWPVK